MKKAVKKTTEKYVTETRFKKFEGTFEQNMRAIAKSFERVERALEIVVRELRAIHIENLTIRVEKLEAKI